MLEWHYQGFCDNFKSKLDDALNDESCYQRETLCYINKNLRDILIGKPHKLREVIQGINYVFKKKPKDDKNNVSDDDDKFYKLVTNIFDYKKFCDNEYKGWNAYNYTKKIGISSCPYCNRQYAHTVIRKNLDDKNSEKNVKLRPDLDHFYPKAKYPFLAVSFYNLVPSCNICNSRFKGDIDFYKEPHSNPFEEGFANETKFKVKIEDIEFFQGKYEKCEIEFEVNKGIDGELEKRIEGNKKDFHIKDVYQEHKDYVYELIHKSMIYSDDYLDDLYKQYEGTIFKNREDLIRMVAANYIDDEDLHLRPLSKLTKDVIEQFGLWK